MPLTNFGSILNFAEELEKLDEGFYREVIGNPASTPYRVVFEQFIADSQKHQKQLQRARRENVTEMIFEGIVDFTRAPFLIDTGSAATMTAAEILAAAAQREERAERYYLEAAVKIKALSIADEAYQG